MSSKVAQKVVQAAKQVSSHEIPVHKKHTIQSTGIWERIRRALAIAPERSNGVPLNPQFRYPAPGSLDPLEFHDAVTLPAADIAENPYWKRDVRRNYARTAVIQQPDMVALLTVGNQKDGAKTELIGEAGEKALVQAREEEGKKGVAAYFREKKDVKSVLGPNGLPPTPGVYGNYDIPVRYEMTEEQSYGKDYPCRTFA